jgi:uncharacterized SAM-binding protein YcdF (DUF218 family)
VWLWLRPQGRGPRRYLLVVVIAYGLLATEAGARLLAGGLSRGMTRVMSPADAHGADAVVILGGGTATAKVGGEIGGTLSATSLLRALEGARVFKTIGARVIIASGGMPRPDVQLRPESEMLREILMRAGIAQEAIVEESVSRNTYEQSRVIGPLLREHRVQRFVLVTSPTHMRRSLAAFRAAGLQPIPSVTPLRSEAAPAPFPLLPNSDSLLLSDEALYDYVAWIYYWSRGWFQAGPAPTSSEIPRNPGPPAATKPRLAPDVDVLTQNAYSRPRVR